MTSTDNDAEALLRAMVSRFEELTAERGVLHAESHSIWQRERAIEKEMATLTTNSGKLWLAAALLACVETPRLSHDSVQLYLPDSYPGPPDAIRAFVRDPKNVRVDLEDGQISGVEDGKVLRNVRFVITKPSVELAEWLKKHGVQLDPYVKAKLPLWNAFLA